MGTLIWGHSCKSTQMGTRTWDTHLGTLTRGDSHGTWDTHWDTEAGTFSGLIRAQSYTELLTYGCSIRLFRVTGFCTQEYACIIETRRVFVLLLDNSCKSAQALSKVEVYAHEYVYELPLRRLAGWWKFKFVKFRKSQRNLGTGVASECTRNHTKQHGGRKFWTSELTM